jgi:hypothetical protein
MHVREEQQQQQQQHRQQQKTQIQVCMAVFLVQ